MVNSEWSVKFDLGIPLAAFTAFNKSYPSFKYFIVIDKASSYYRLLFMLDSEGFLNTQYSGYYYVYYI